MCIIMLFEIPLKAPALPMSGQVYRKWNIYILECHRRKQCVFSGSRTYRSIEDAVQTMGLIYLVSGTPMAASDSCQPTSQAAYSLLRPEPACTLPSPQSGAHSGNV